MTEGPLVADLAASATCPVLGPGFAGPVAPYDGQAWTILRQPVETLTLYESDPRDPFETLAAFCAQIPPSGAVACVLAYEAAGRATGLPLPPVPGGLPVLHAVKAAEAIRAASPFDTMTAGGAPRCVAVTRSGGAPFQAAVARIVEAIAKGEIFQANISRRLTARFDAAPGLESALFGRLVADGAAPYAAFIPVPGGSVLSNSPELFLSVDGCHVAAEPVKGTMPRGETQEEDRRLAQALLRSDKDRAENLMIADLLRNDLAKVCEDHSLREPAVAALRSHRRVHHLYSRIEGTLRPGLGAIDALAAAFPCGSVTGAPKHRAMQHIARLEGEGRGAYCGAIGLVRPGGDAIFSVPIRTGILRLEGAAAILDVRTGGGITILSDPAAEFAETEAKAYPFEAMIR